MVFNPRHAFGQVNVFSLPGREPAVKRELESPTGEYIVREQVLGSVGSWIGNPFPNGALIDFLGFQMRVMEVERGWIPEAGCCPSGRPDVLVVSSSSDMLTGMRGSAYEHLVLNEELDGEKFDGATEYVRVKIDATNSGAPEDDSEFDASHFILVDTERRLYAGGFYPREEMHLRRAHRELGTGFEWPEQHDSRSADVYGGGRVSEELAWLVPRDAEGLILAYVPYEYQSGVFFALDETDPIGPSEESAIPTWVERAKHAVDIERWEAVPLGTGVTFGRRVAVRLSSAVGSPSPCDDRYMPLEDYECMRVRMDIFVERYEEIRGLFHGNLVALFLGRELTVDPRWKEEIRFEMEQRTFDSELDWVELNGQGSLSVTYTLEVPTGWEKGMLWYRSNLAAYEGIQFVNFALSEDAAGRTPEGYEAGLYGYIDASGFLFEPDEVELMIDLTKLGLDCASYVADPRKNKAYAVFVSAWFLGETKIGELAPGFFAQPRDADKTCALAFPSSSKQQVLKLVAVYVGHACLTDGQTEFAGLSINAMEYGETLFEYWGDEAPASITDFGGDPELCAWMSDEENAAITELLEETHIPVLAID